MDPEPESLEAMKTKIKNMMQCVELVRLAVVKVGISNSVDIPNVRFSLDGHDEEHELKEILTRLLSQYKDLVNHVLSYHLKVSNFSFMWPESEVEVDVMDTIAKCLLRMCDQRGVGLVAAPPNSVVAAPPNSGVAAPPNSGVAAPPNSGVAAPPNSGVAAPPNAGVAAPPNAGVAAPPGGFISWLTARGDRFTGVVDSLMVLMVLCCFAWTFGKAVGVLCFGFILGTLITREIKRI